MRNKNGSKSKILCSILLFGGIGAVVFAIIAAFYNPDYESVVGLCLVAFVFGATGLVNIGTTVDLDRIEKKIDQLLEKKEE
jgi:hypothetical protein